MKSRTRYGLIAAGFAAFIVLAPFLVLFISGIKYDFSTRKFVKTGLLSASSDPKGATIYINGKLSGKTNDTFRFLAPGDYQLDLKKDGYFTWSKQINIREQYATMTASQARGVTLFYAQAKKTNIAENVINAYAGNQKLLYVLADKIIYTNISNPNQDDAIALPKTLQSAEIIATENENYYLLRAQNFVALFDAGNAKIYDLSDLLATDIKNPLQLALANDGSLYELTYQQKLYEISWQDSNLNKLTSKKLLLNNILAFLPSADNYSIYVVTKNKKQQNIFALVQLPSLTETVLAKNIPQFKTAQILASRNNQLFLLADQSLYAIAQPSSLIADNVSYARVENNNQDLLYGNANEINAYNLLSTEKTFITRSSANISNALGALDLGWVFYLSNGALQAIEADNRGIQNNFSFAPASAGAKFFLDTNEENILLLTNGTLSKLRIR